MDMRFIAVFSSSYIKGLFIFVWKKDYFIHENRKSRRPFLNIQRTYPSAKKKAVFVLYPIAKCFPASLSPFLLIGVGWQVNGA